MLLEQGHHVVGIDNMNDYYDVSLKQHRVDQLTSGAPDPGKFEFVKMDLETAIKSASCSIGMHTMPLLISRRGRAFDTA